MNIFGINFSLLQYSKRCFITFYIYIECDEASFTISDSVLGSIFFQLQGHLDLSLEREGFSHFLLILWSTYIDIFYPNKNIIPVLNRKFIVFRKLAVLFPKTRSHHRYRLKKPSSHVFELFMIPYKFCKNLIPYQWYGSIRKRSLVSISRKKCT